jgi:aminoglycoside/choline kinase family phosphotransferase
MDNRQQQLETWLKTHCQLVDCKIEPLAMDASFRRYFRVWHIGKTFVAMDAPPEWETSTPQFVAIAKTLRAQGLHAPEVIAADLPLGFLLLTDLGDKLYLKELTLTNAENLYTRALEALAVLQACRHVHGYTVPPFTQDFMQQELLLCKEWFLQKHLLLEFSPATEKMLTDFFNFIVYTVSQQPLVFMHRDYHSANLLVLPKKAVGILDFQDAFIGPVTYDLVSLLRDCYITFPDALIQKLVLEYKIEINLPGSADVFLRDFDIMSMQRHLKALLTFSRKYHRDQNTNYLQHMPRTLAYIEKVSERHPEGKEFNEYLNTSILPAFEKVKILCAQ